MRSGTNSYFFAKGYRNPIDLERRTMLYDRLKNAPLNDFGLLLLFNQIFRTLWTFTCLMFVHIRML